MDIMDKNIQRWEQGVLESFDLNDPLANFQQYGVEVEYKTKGNTTDVEKTIENEEHWLLSASTGLNLQIMAFGPSALRDLEKHMDSEGKVELLVLKAKHTKCRLNFYILCLLPMYKVELLTLMTKHLCVVKHQSRPNCFYRVTVFVRWSKRLSVQGVLYGSLMTV